MPFDIGKLNGLEDENAKMKKLLAEVLIFKKNVLNRQLSGTLPLPSFAAIVLDLRMID